MFLPFLSPVLFHLHGFCTCDNDGLIALKFKFFDGKIFAFQEFSFGPELYLSGGRVEAVSDIGTKIGESRFLVELQWIIFRPVAREITDSYMKIDVIFLAVLSFLFFQEQFFSQLK